MTTRNIENFEATEQTLVHEAAFKNEEQEMFLEDEVLQTTEATTETSEKEINPG